MGRGALRHAVAEARLARVAGGDAAPAIRNVGFEPGRRASA
ncbi:hypothetical protein [Wenxinia marina]|nr:hypothetical protein [Wenxinia marina]